VNQTSRKATVAALLFCFTVGGLLWTFWPRLGQEPIDDQVPTDSVATSIEDTRPIEVLDAGYVSSNECKSCHPQQHSSWTQSYHRTMTQYATPDVITANMDNTDVTVGGRDFHFSQRDNTCWVELDDPDNSGQKIERPIVMTTGSHHMQVYWYPSGDSRALGQVPLVFLHETNRWIPRDAAFLVPPDIPFDSETTRWNETCIACHTTHPQSRPVDDHAWDSRVAELGISCEACHGPGEKHVSLRRSEALQDFDDPMKSPAKMPHTRSAEVCGQCHSITTARNSQELQAAKTQGYLYRPGDDLSKSRVIIRNTRSSLAHVARHMGPDGVEPYMRDRFWPDGMVRISGREFNGLIDSPCYQRGKLSCISCHDMHKSEQDQRTREAWANDMLDPKMTDNQACLQCHKSQEYGAQHTHHAENSSGSLCYNCHMPHTTYGLLKAIRSHQISSPNAQKSVAAERPMACNLCHLDRTLEWSANHLKSWYDIEPPTLDDDQKTVADSLLWLLKGDAGQRALAAWHMGWQPAKDVSGDGWQAPFLSYLLDDPYDAIRFIAQRSLQSLPDFGSFKKLTNYDFVTKPAKRPSIHARIQALWAARPAIEQRSHVLIDSAGNLEQKKIDQLRNDRNDRPVNLVE
jgi:nitrate/TMAO reductase-like tetraheme cytochrome c subunit